jgi:hypothetical protein
MPISANVEFTLYVFRSQIPAKKFLVLKDANLLLKSAVGILRTECCGKGVVRCKAGTRQQGECNYMWSFII